MRRWLVLSVLFLVGPAQAQRLGLPVPDVGGLPVVRQLPGVIERTTDRLDALVGSRLQQVQSLLERHPDVLEASPGGGVMVRHQIVAMSPSVEALRLAQAQGFEVISEQPIDGLDARVVVLGVPKGKSTQKALKALRKSDPTGVYDFNDIYLESQSGPPAPAQVKPAGLAPQAAPGTRIGLIDGGVEADHPVFRGVKITQQGFAGAVVPSPHGTATASLIVGRAEGFSGSAPGAELIVADVYGNAPTGGSTTAVIQALGFMVRTRVPVISISLTGPANASLGAVVSELNRRGYLIVAAVGNEGPAAKPMYPAAFDGVVGVTGVDARDKVLFEAGRGPQVDVSAPGADMAAAALAGRFVSVRGTSFAAPVVAGLLARRLSVPDAKMAAAAVSALVAQSRDLGAKGVDVIYGVGVVGEEFRYDLQSVAKNMKKISQGAEKK
jgi:subtilisin family serine protease